jgi:hypothetical protein
MARNRKATPEVEKAASYLQGVAKNLVDRIYGPRGPAWGTKFSEIEATVAAIREVLSEEMFQQALSRQAAETERPRYTVRIPRAIVGRCYRQGNP